jgi:hypothetical protein
MAEELNPSDVFAGDAPLTKLVDQLDDAFPLYNPSPDDNLAKIMFLAGQRSVVEFIKSTIED